MIEYIKGEISELNPTYVVIEQGNIGYYIHIGLHTYSKIQSLKEVKLYTFQYIREDIRMMFGFSNKEERRIFELFLNISGIGPNTARLIISSMTPSQVVNAISMEDDESFKNVKGIGAKTAKRIIIDLKDKIEQLDISPSTSSETPLPESTNTQMVEAREALLTLGFPRNKVQMALAKIKKEGHGDSVENIIKEALKLLS
ncbi:Holliday junction branch migration protein RuvA [Membranihabitans marinus]|uniref:Holliday junction branch migration protein RuvA n=1 Tax=Membranihabitans marinus TaxID=1227546 RepID=UPI001F03126C|nr:Holliday junction branch migration protein RuvA [Membranihabitans marinus]